MQFVPRETTTQSARRGSAFSFFFLFVSLNIIFIVFNAYRLFTSATLAVGVFTWTDESHWHSYSGARLSGPPPRHKQLLPFFQLSNNYVTLAATKTAAWATDFVPHFQIQASLNFLQRVKRCSWAGFFHDSVDLEMSKKIAALANLRHVIYLSGRGQPRCSWIWMK